jgi:hypothetical protein
MDLAPIILELVLWSDKHVRAYHAEMNAYENQDLNKSKFIEGIKKEYRELVSQLID